MIFTKLIDKNKIKILHTYNDIIEKIYPELKLYLKNNICCDLRYKENLRVLSAICMLGGKNRNLKPLISATSKDFITQLTNIENKNIIPLDTIFQIPKPIVRQCLDCTKEHIAKAVIWLIQYKKDDKLYSEDYWLAIGELGHAEMECIEINKDLSKAIRIEKRKLIENKNAKIDLIQFLK